MLFLGLPLLAIPPELPPIALLLVALLLVGPGLGPRIEFLGLDVRAGGSVNVGGAGRCAMKALTKPGLGNAELEVEIWWEESCVGLDNWAEMVLAAVRGGK